MHLHHRRGSHAPKVVRVETTRRISRAWSPQALRGQVLGAGLNQAGSAASAAYSPTVAVRPYFGGTLMPAWSRIIASVARPLSVSA